MNTSNQPKKQISFFLAILPLIFMAVSIGIMHIWLHVDLKFILLLSAIFAGLVAYFVGIDLKTLFNDYGENIKKAFPTMLILIAIGGIVGTWMYSGTVPYLIYYGLHFIHPNYVIVSAFLVTGAVSLFTGTSWGSAATAGVAFMGIGQSYGIPLEMVAGAALSGAFLGDKISPVSDTTNVCALASGVSVYDHIRGMLPNVILSTIIAIIAFTFIGMNLEPTLGENLAVQQILSDLDANYNFNLSMLLPAAIVVYGGIKGYNPVLLMVGSSLVAIVVGLISHGFSFADGASSLITGFNSTMFLAETTVSPVIETLVNRGGFEGMTSGAVLYCFIAVAFGSFMESFGALQRIMDALLRRIKSKYGLITAAFFAGGGLNGVSGNGVFSILTIGKMFGDPFEDRKIPRAVLSRSMENSMTLLESLMPWHVSAVYMTATLGVSTIEYIPYAIFNTVGILLFFVLTANDLRRKRY